MQFLQKFWTKQMKIKAFTRHVKTAFHLLSQYGLEKSNKIVEDEAFFFAGLKSTLQRFRIYFFQNPSFMGVESTS